MVAGGFAEVGDLVEGLFAAADDGAAEVLVNLDVGMRCIRTLDGDQVSGTVNGGPAIGDQRRYVGCQVHQVERARRKRRGAGDAKDRVAGRGQVGVDAPTTGDAGAERAAGDDQLIRIVIDREVHA